MRLTKRQLKRIIREEYSRLKRRGLIRENNVHSSPLIQQFFNFSDEYIAPQTPDQWAQAMGIAGEPEVDDVIWSEDFMEFIYNENPPQIQRFVTEDDDYDLDQILAAVKAGQL